MLLPETSSPVVVFLSAAVLSVTGSAVWVFFVVLRLFVMFSVVAVRSFPERKGWREKEVMAFLVPLPELIFAAGSIVADTPSCCVIAGLAAVAGSFVEDSV